jgi:peptidyl-prolyl cis-trans isomerase B (cyclophilin B)
MKLSHWFLSVLLMGAIFIGSCTTQNAAVQSPTSAASDSTANSTTASATASATSSPASPTTSPKTSPSASASASASAASNVPQQYANLPQLAGKATVEMEIKGGKVVIEVDGTNAPVTAGNFVDLVKRGVYNGASFHRVETDPQFSLVQGGDPQSKDPNVPADMLGTGSYVDEAGMPRYVPLEIKAQGEEQPTYGQPITKPPVLTHQRGVIAMARSQVPDSASAQFYITRVEIGQLDGSYAVFGKVTSGLEVLDKVQVGDRITSAKVIQGGN